MLFKNLKPGDMLRYCDLEPSDNLSESEVIDLVTSMVKIEKGWMRIQFVRSRHGRLEIFEHVCYPEAVMSWRYNLVQGALPRSSPW
jgi:hypothetical protein